MGSSIWGVIGQGGGAWGGTIVVWLAIILLFVFMIVRPQQKERAKRENMLAGIKKNDRVVTIGGIYGVVTNVQKEQDEITLRIDESTNTKIRVQFGAIGRVLEEAASGDSAKES